MFARVIAGLGLANVVFTGASTIAGRWVTELDVAVALPVVLLATVPLFAIPYPEWRRRRAQHRPSVAQ